MSWKIRLHERRPEKPAVGDMWPAPWLIDMDRANPASRWVSAEYRRDWLGKRPPMVVVLPGYGEWCIDSPMSGTKLGWLVTGQPPAVTITPSINCEGIYHGFILDGVVGDDVEGRRFP